MKDTNLTYKNTVQVSYEGYLFRFLDLHQQNYVDSLSSVTVKARQTLRKTTESELQLSVQ